MEFSELSEDGTGLLCVFYGNSPFSDFASSSFTIDGDSYNSVEHYFQIQMLRSFGLFKLVSRISEITDTNVARRIVRQNLHTLIQSGLFDERMFNSWRETNAMRMMKKANRAKFEQNFDMKRYLIETGDRILVFTSKHDTLLGVGMDESTFLEWIRQQRWKTEDLLDAFAGQINTTSNGAIGKNVLGQCLMEIRSSLNSRPSILTIWTQRNRGKNVGTNGGSVSETVSISGQDMPDEEDDGPSDEQIFENLRKAEANVANENEQYEDNCEPATSSAGVAFRVPNEKRIVYRRPNFVQRVVGGCDVVTVGKPNEEVTSDAEGKRKSVLEEIKALRFEKPMLNPFAITPAAPLGDKKHGCGEMSINANRPRKLRRLCDLRFGARPTCVGRYVFQYPELEPGEVPAPDYGPQLLPANPADTATRGGFTPVANRYANGTWSAGQCEPLFSSPAPTCSTSNDDSGEPWAPSSNPMKDVFESAKVGIQKLLENSKQNSGPTEAVSKLLLLRPPPIQSESHARKRKCTNKRAAPIYAGLIFNSKDAQMRHVANRWVKGGRLTTTGKFEETLSDEEDSGEVDRTLRQLEAAEEEANRTASDKPVQLHVVYEDTNEYADYVKWYADVHGCVPSDANDDEYQQYLRHWFRYYRTAVKFVDVEEAVDSDEADSDEERTVTDADRCGSLMEQWRWHQSNQWMLRAKAHSSSSNITQETHTDGVSISGKPVRYVQ